MKKLNEKSEDGGCKFKCDESKCDEYDKTQGEEFTC